MIQRISSLYYAPSDTHGRGVFTISDIPKNSIIEVCPVIIVPPKDMELLKQTVLYNYYFIWGEDEKSGAIALGLGSVYNHAYHPNARYFVDFEHATIEIHTIQDIRAGEEIFISYNGDPEDQSTVWFEERS